MGKLQFTKYPHSVDKSKQLKKAITKNKRASMYAKLALGLSIINTALLVAMHLKLF